MAKKRLKRQPKKLSIDVIETQAIVIVDEYGSERATVSCSGGDGGKGGMTLIQINDDAGRPRLELQVDSNGNPNIRLSTPNDGSGVSLGVNDESGNGISVGDYKGNSCILIGVSNPASQNPNGTRPDIILFDEAKQIAWSAFDGTYEYKPVDDNAT